MLGANSRSLYKRSTLSCWKDCTRLIFNDEWAPGPLASKTRCSYKTSQQQSRLIATIELSVLSFPMETREPMVIAETNRRLFFYDQDHFHTILNASFTEVCQLADHDYIHLHYIILWLLFRCFLSPTIILCEETLRLMPSMYDWAGNFNVNYQTEH